MSEHIEQCKNCTHATWRDLALELLPFLQTFRTWTMLLEWGKKNKVSEMHVRNTLAWLNLQGLAYFRKEAAGPEWYARTVNPGPACSKCNAFVHDKVCRLCGVSETKKTKKVVERCELPG